jgi:hypothetical protein
MRQIEGSSPDALRRDLAKVCVSFDGGLERLAKRSASVLEQTRVAGALYAGILRVHPVADGNHRAGFVALSAALWSLGLPAVEFAQDADMTDHDDAVAPALFSPDGDIEPCYSNGDRSALLLSASKRRFNQSRPLALSDSSPRVGLAVARSTSVCRRGRSRR